MTTMICEDDEYDEYDEYEGYDDVCEIPLVASVQETSKKFAAASFSAASDADGAKDGRVDPCDHATLVRTPWLPGAKTTLRAETEASSERARNALDIHTDMLPVRIPIAKDNHCLFNSIAYLCCDGAQGESVARSLRNGIADHITNDPQTYNEVMLGMSRADYCKWIKDDLNWGGENEICILCEHFNVEIQVICMEEHSSSLTYGETNDTHRVRTGRIFLLYSGQHYDALVGHERDQAGGRITKMFPVGISEMCSLAIACGVQEFNNLNYTGNDGIIDLEDDGTSQGGVTAKLSTKEQYRVAVGKAKQQIQTEPQVQSRPRPVTIGGQGLSDKELQEYLQIVRERVSSDLQFTQTEASAIKMYTGTEAHSERIKSLKLVQELTEEELKKVQEKNRVPVLDLDTTAGLGLRFSFTETGRSYWVSKVLERSAANFAGVLEGDILLQVDDRVVSVKDDIARCIGPYGSVVHLKFARPADGSTSTFWVSLIREIQASKRPSVNHNLVLTGGTTKVTDDVDFLQPAARAVNMPLTPLTPDFVQEARSLVQSGGFLKMGIHEVCMKSNGSEGMHEIQWKRVFVHVIPGGDCLVIDKKPTSYGSSRIVFATLPPDAGADLQELQIMNLQNRHSSVPWGSGKKQNIGSTFQIHVKIFFKCHAYSQWGLFEIDCTRVLEFRASNAHEANLWIKGINSIVSDRKEPAGVRPSRESVLQTVNGPISVLQSVYGPENAARFHESLSSEGHVHRLSSEGRVQSKEVPNHMVKTIWERILSRRKSQTLLASDAAQHSCRNAAAADGIWDGIWDGLSRPAVHQSVLEEMGFTKDQILSARQAFKKQIIDEIKPNISCPTSEDFLVLASAEDPRVILEWLLKNGIEPQVTATLGFPEPRRRSY